MKMGTEIVVMILIVLMAPIAVWAFWAGHSECERKHPVRCKCEHMLDAHAATGTEDMFILVMVVVFFIMCYFASQEKK